MLRVMRKSTTTVNWMLASVNSNNRSLKDFVRPVVRPLVAASSFIFYYPEDSCIRVLNIGYLQYMSRMVGRAVFCEPPVGTFDDDGRQLEFECKQPVHICEQFVIV